MLSQIVDQARHIVVRKRLVQQLLLDFNTVKISLLLCKCCHVWNLQTIKKLWLEFGSFNFCFFLHTGYLYTVCLQY